MPTSCCLDISAKELVSSRVKSTANVSVISSMMQTRQLVALTTAISYGLGRLENSRATEKHNLSLAAEDSAVASECTESIHSSINMTLTHASH